MVQVPVYSARGFLIESTDTTWLYGTASEHSVYYQYNFHRAQNIFTTMIQSEKPYYQPTPSAPEPFTSAVGVQSGDPDYTCAGGDFDGCDESWGMLVTASANLHIGGADIYSWFSSYSQDCIADQTCQKVLWQFADNYDGGVRVQHMITIGAEYMLVSNNAGVAATDNLVANSSPFWSDVSIYDAPSSGAAP
jgi:hypothetical protein